MNRIFAIALLMIGNAAAAQATPANPEEQHEAREEARELVHRAYLASRTYCSMYPASSQDVRVTTDGMPIEIRVQCEVVNEYFRHHDF